MIRHCTVSDVDYIKGMVKVSYDDINIQSEWLKVFQGRTSGTKEYSMPIVGEKGLVLTAENGANGFYLGGAYSDVNLAIGSKGKTITIFSDGTIVQYDENTSKLFIDCKKDIEVICPTITITGNVKITGDVDVIGDITADGISLTKHTHDYNPGPGGATPTAKPK